jgi:hypothetical protein
MVQKSVTHVLDLTHLTLIYAAQFFEIPLQLLVYSEHILLQCDGGTPFFLLFVVICYF